MTTKYNLDRSLASHWRLDPDVVHANHGSFGACPSVVLDRQRELQLEMESNTLFFFERTLPKLMDEARHALAGVIGANHEHIALIPNATTGVNTALANVSLEPGDEVLVTDHGYRACTNAANFYARRAGARVVTANIPFPLTSKDDLIGPLLRACSSRTRLALIDHITSPTGLILPLEVIVPELQKRGVEVLIDGAHAPGMVPLNLDALSPDFYTGNCHKWLCTPKGTAFIYVNPRHQKGFQPLTISHGMTMTREGMSPFRLEFDWTGTGDPTGFMCLPEAIAFLSSNFEGGLVAHMARNRNLTLAARHLISETLNLTLPCPDEMIGALASFILPDDPRYPPAPFEADPIHDLLSLQHKVEVPVFSWPSPKSRILRISAQLYNNLDDYRRLVHAVKPLLPSHGAT